jgi:hypothetical protein
LFPSSRIHRGFERPIHEYVNAERSSTRVIDARRRRHQPQEQVAISEPRRCGSAPHLPLMMCDTRIAVHLIRMTGSVSSYGPTTRVVLEGANGINLREKGSGGRSGFVSKSLTRIWKDLLVPRWHVVYAAGVSVVVRQGGNFRVRHGPHGPTTRVSLGNCERFRFASHYTYCNCREHFEGASSTNCCHRKSQTPSDSSPQINQCKLQPNSEAMHLRR